MRKRVITFIGACFYYSGLVNLARWWTRRAGQRLIVLNYHRAIGENLHHQLLYLRRHYRILHLEAALEELFTPHKDRHGRVDRRTPLVLTFDDGHHDNYTHAFALACELHIPLTIFLIPGYVDSGARFWWMEGKHLVRHAQVSEAAIEGRSYHLQRQEEQEALARMIDTRLRQAASVAGRETFLASACKILNVSSSPEAEEQLSLPLTWAEVQEMEESGWVSFGAHTMHHPILAYLVDFSDVQHEVNECRVILEQRLKHPVHTFAYPVGQFEYITDDVIHTVRDAGYTWALTTVYGINTPQNDPYRLCRIEVDASQHWWVVAAATAGLWGIFSRLRWVPTIRRYLANPLQR